MSEVKRYTLPEVPHLVHGRTNDSLTPLTLFWTAAGLELNVRGSELWVEFTADWDIHEPWYSFMVNGEFFSRRMAQKGTERVCVFRGMDPEKVKNAPYQSVCHQLDESNMDDPEQWAVTWRCYLRKFQ